MVMVMVIVIEDGHIWSEGVEHETKVIGNCNWKFVIVIGKSIICTGVCETDI